MSGNARFLVNKYTPRKFYRLMHVARVLYLKLTQKWAKRGSDVMIKYESSFDLGILEIEEYSLSYK